MHELAVAAFDALDAGEFADLLDRLHTRVFDRPPQDLLDVELVDDIWEWRFKPLVELLLRHIVDVAGNSRISSDARRDEIRLALDMLEL